MASWEAGKVKDWSLIAAVALLSGLAASAATKHLEARTRRRKATRSEAAIAIADRAGLVIRDARTHDLPRLLQLLAADQLGSSREEVSDPPARCYLQAFEDIDSDPGHRLLVVERAGEVIGFFQLSFLPGLARGGSRRAQIESVRVASSERGRGVGATMIQWAVEEAKANACSLVQLTSDKQRPEAHRFYGRAGFVATHEGFKLKL
mmetsp:Transcript_3047/g.7389  ORF Transcript_3047/g.7389 Transcript_3047/m.7389 type:complete len:206 (+) Transcript_3047:87-704(+)